MSDELRIPSEIAGHMSVDAAAAELEGKYHYKQELQRKLNVWHLTAFGVNWLAPFGPMVILGYVVATSGGNGAFPYIIAGIAMMMTGAAYAAMVPNFPLAGSAYSYISKGWNPYLGFIVGWIMMTDYLLIPALTTVSLAFQAGQLLPAVPYWGLIAGIAVFTGIINFIGVEVMAKLGLWLLVITFTAMLICWVAWSYGASGGAGFGSVLTMEALRFDSLSALGGASALAMLNYLGFDAITTLAEESHNPKKDIPIAIYATVGIGIFMFAGTGYFGTLPIGDLWRQYVGDEAWMNTFTYQAALVSAGQWFATFFFLAFALCIGLFNIVATAAASRLLYGMGRDRLLPYFIFGKINKRFGTPHWNILIIATLILVIGTGVGLDTITAVVSFGALSGFFVMNLNIIWMYIVKKNAEYIRWKPQSLVFYLRYLIIPIFGAISMAYLWINLGSIAHWAGSTWAGLGLIVLAINTKGFRKLPTQLDL